MYMIQPFSSCIKRARSIKNKEYLCRISFLRTLDIMDYQNFEAHIDYRILQSGQQYFAFEAVKELEQTKEGWQAKVSGTNTYEVVINGEHTISDWNCSCPYDHGPVCKHVAAVLYAIQNRKFEEMMRNK